MTITEKIFRTVMKKEQAIIQEEGLEIWLNEHPVSLDDIIDEMSETFPLNGEEDDEYIKSALPYAKEVLALINARRAEAKAALKAVKLNLMEF